MIRSSPGFGIVGTPAHPAACLELQLKGDARARETAHYGSDRHPRNFGRLLVAEPIDGHEQQRRSLVGRQTTNGPPDLIERQPGLDASHRLIRSQPLLGYFAILLTNFSPTGLVDPDRL